MTTKRGTAECLDFSDEKSLENLNKEKLKAKIMFAISDDKSKLIMQIHSRLKREIAEIFKKYFVSSDDDICVKIQNLSSGKFAIVVECLCDGFLKN